MDSLPQIGKVTLDPTFVLKSSLRGGRRNSLCFLGGWLKSGMSSS